MRVLSANPFLYKRGPALVAVVLGLWVAFASAQQPDLTGLVMVAILLGAGVVAMRMAAWDFADKVHDGGDHLVVRYGKEEQRIPFDHIERVAESHVLRAPTRIELVLKHPGKFGRVIVFIPAGFFTQMSLGKTAIFHELDGRVRRSDS